MIRSNLRYDEYCEYCTEVMKISIKNEKKIALKQLSIYSVDVHIFQHSQKTHTKII